MKILHTVEFYEPSKGGAQEVVRQLSEHMVMAGHDVTVATTRLPERKSKTINGVKMVEFGIKGNEVLGYEGETDAYRDFLLNSNFDIVMNYAAQQWASDLFFEVMNQVEGAKVLVPCGFSGLHNPVYKGYFQRMPELLKAYDATVYLSPTYRDTEFAKKHNVKNIHIIPNGADEREFTSLPNIDIKAKLKLLPDCFLILSVGSHTGLKGHQEAIEIYKQANIPNSCLLIIGNQFDRNGCLKICKRLSTRFNLASRLKKAAQKVIIKDIDRTHTLAAFRQADLFLFPSNIEASPLVLFEACASRTPFLSTDVGNSREIAKWTGGGEILPTNKDSQRYSHAKIAESAKMLEGLYNKKSQREKMAETGYRNWKNMYSWAKISDSYLKLYKEVLNK